MTVSGIRSNSYSNPVSPDRRIHAFQIWIMTICLMILLGVAGGFMYYVQFTPTINDIYSIYKISALDGGGRWVNGFFGNGYTLIYLTGGSSFVLLGAIYLTVMAVSFVLMSRFLSILMNEEYLLSALFALFFHLFLVGLLKTNFTDGIFLFLLTTGLSLYLYGYFLKVKSGARAISQNVQLEFTGLIVAGFTILFRHHGLLFLFIFVTIMLLFGNGRNRRITFSRWVSSYGAMFLITFGYLFLSLIIPDLRMEQWQNFNLYKFFHGVNWYQIDLLLDSDSYRDFQFTAAILENPVRLLSRSGGVIVQNVLPLLFLAGIPLAGYVITKDRFHLCVLLTVLLYVPLVFPGLDRGFYPLLPAVFITIVFLMFWSVKRLPLFITFFVLLFLVAGWSVFHLSQEAIELRDQNRYVQNELEPELAALGAENAAEIFTDDFNLRLFEYNTLGLRNFQGWLHLHPDFRGMKPNRMFEQQSFLEHNIRYVVYLRNGYISETYPELPCREEVSLEKHHICIL